MKLISWNVNGIRACMGKGFADISPGEGNNYPLQYSGMENSMNRGAWKATVHGVAKSWT